MNPSCYARDAGERPLGGLVPMAQPVWHLSRDGKQWGPFSHEELLQRAARGEVWSDDLLWKPGLTDWTPASSIPGLLSTPVPSALSAKKTSTTATQLGSPDFLGLRRLWRGEQPLWKAFWVYYFLVGGWLIPPAVGVLGVALLASIGAAGLFGFAILFPLAMAYEVCAIVGTWRSASWTKLSGIAARAYVVISLTLWVLFVVGALLSAYKGGVTRTSDASLSEFVTASLTEARTAAQTSPGIIAPGDMLSRL